MKIEIPQFTRDGHYQVNQDWVGIENWITRQTERNGLDINPDFQRAHVWTEDQQRAFVEFCLRGGQQGSNMIRFNCVGWMDDFRGPFVLVDGKQRLEAVRKFLRNELRVFPKLDTKTGYGFFLQDLEDRLTWKHDLIVVINDLATRREVLQWYLDINTGGVVHTGKEIRKVQLLLEKEIA